MDDYRFENEESVQKEAERIIASILGDKSYTNPEKISLLIQDYEKKQVKLDAQLAKAIHAQIECIRQAKQCISEANNSMKEANQRTDNISDTYREQKEFHQFMEDVVTLSTFQTNLGKVIQQLTYFIDMDSQMQRLERLSEDQGRYPFVSSKLIELIELRDALLQQESWQRETAIMRKEFMKVDTFETNFYEKIFLKFNNCIEQAKENPEGLKIAVKVIEAYDKALEARKKSKVMRIRAIEVIKNSIDDRFEKNLQDQDDLIGIIQHAKFTTTDLVDVGDYVVSCFPLDFPIMQVFQEQYQANIEKRVLPYFEQIQEEKQYGHLVVLLGWIDDYETMLSRAGLDSNSLLALKSKVKIMMPLFLDHNRKIVQDYIVQCIAEDAKNYNRAFYTDLIRDGSDLVSMFPSDMFRFINQEAEVIKDQLKGEIFIQFVRCITETISCHQQQLTETVLKEYESVSKDGSSQAIVDYEYKLLLFINNYGECLRHAGESKEIFTEYVTEEYKARIEKIFLMEVQKEFNQSIPRFITMIVGIVFLDTTREHYPKLFTPKWVDNRTGDTMSSICKVVSAELNDIDQQSLIISLPHYRMLVKESLQYLVSAYVEQLIVFIRVIFRANAHMEVKYCSEKASLKEYLNHQKQCRGVFGSRVQFSEAIKKDKHQFMKFCQGFSECTSKAFTSKLQNKFVMLGDLFMKKMGEFQSMIGKVIQSFPEQGAELIEVLLIVREDIDSQSVSMPKRGLDY